MASVGRGARESMETFVEVFLVSPNFSQMFAILLGVPAPLGSYRLAHIILWSTLFHSSGLLARRFRSRAVTRLTWRHDSAPCPASGDGTASA